MRLSVGTDQQVTVQQRLLTMRRDVSVTASPNALLQSRKDENDIALRLINLLRQHIRATRNWNIVLMYRVRSQVVLVVDGVLQKAVLDSMRKLNKV